MCSWCNNNNRKGKTNHHAEVINAGEGCECGVPQRVRIGGRGWGGGKGKGAGGMLWGEEAAGTWRLWREVLVEGTGGGWGVWVNGCGELFQALINELNYVIVKLFMGMGEQGWNVPLLGLAPDHTDHDFFLPWRSGVEGDGIVT